MNFQSILFQVTSVSIPILTSMVVLSPHPIFSLLFLVTSFLLATLLLFLMECELLALLFIIVYVGAVAVLFLFAVMMLEFKVSDLTKNSLQYIPIGTLLGLFLLFASICQVSNSQRALNDSTYFYFNAYQNWYDLLDSVDDIEVYGNVLYSFYVFQFLTCGFILLLVLIGVVCINQPAGRLYAVLSCCKPRHQVATAY